MKKISEMGYSEFMTEMNEYVNSLEEGIESSDGELLTKEEWADWIMKEFSDKEKSEEDIDDERIGWIVERLEEDGFVKPTLWYAVQETREDGWETGSFNYNKAVEMLKEQGNGLIAVIEMGDDPVCVKEIEYEEV